MDLLKRDDESVSEDGNDPTEPSDFASVAVQSEGTRSKSSIPSAVVSLENDDDFKIEEV